MNDPWGTEELMGNPDLYDEDAEIVRRETDDMDPYSNDFRSDDEIKQDIYTRDSYYDDHPPDGCE